MCSLKRNEDDIKEAIRDQLTFIKNSCNLYDAGYRVEGTRIATAINVLLEPEKKGRKEGKGLLRRVGSHNFKLLSTVPDSKKINVDSLIVPDCKNKAESKAEIIKLKNSIKNENKFLLRYIFDSDQWNFFPYINNSDHILCTVEDISQYINSEEQDVILNNCIFDCRVTYNKINNLGEQAIINNFNIIIGNDVFYSKGTYLPTSIKTEEVKNSFQIDFVEKYIDIDRWLGEIIFPENTSSQKDFILSRNELINSARDQDGGAHYDITLDNDSYIKSKEGGVYVMNAEGEKFSTDNYNLHMLRKLGYEILNSQTIQEYLKRD